VKTYLSRSASRFWAAHEPVGDAFGGAAYSERCDPATVMIVGTAIGATGSLASAANGANAARYNAQVNDQNATIARQQGEVDAFQQEQLGYRKLSGIKAAVGASGLRMEGFAPRHPAIQRVERRAGRAAHPLQRDAEGHGVSEQCRS
jgi:hypothetical protein